MSHPVAVLAIADPSFRQRLGKTLTGLRWNVVETGGGAEAMAQLEHGSSQAVILDRWLPDLDVNEFFREVESCYPDIDLISVDGSLQSTTPPRNGRRGELMHAIRVSQECDVAATPVLSTDPPLPSANSQSSAMDRLLPRGTGSPKLARRSGSHHLSPSGCAPAVPVSSAAASALPLSQKAASVQEATGVGQETAVPEFLGTHPCMQEVVRRVRLVAKRTTPVLVQGPSGSGKELVARAIHRLSPRWNRPFVVLNCAAIPESLLEAELFGHTRGAFTGAVQGRVGRIESAHGGTLFLDEIGEMPLALQSKLLRFLEAGEIQRVGDNDSLTVDVRVVAATHQPLALRAKQGRFREDVFYRLAVFVIKTPALREHMSDVPLLAATFLKRLSETSPAKRLHVSALNRLLAYEWPGSVRELAHVMERAYILAEARSEIMAEDIEYEDPGSMQENVSVADREENELISLPT